MIYILASNARQYDVILADLQDKFILTKRPSHISSYNYTYLLRGIRSATIFHEGNMPALISELNLMHPHRLTFIEFQDRRIVKD